MNDESVIVRCNSCGAKNRVPRNRLADNPVCGKCKSPLPAGSSVLKPVDVTDNTFHSEVLSFRGPVFIDCWAPWCGPCRTVGPIIEALAQEYAGSVKIAKLNVDENPQTASKYGIRSIPTMLMFKNGSLVNTLIGALPKNELKSQLDSLL